ncbi:MAG: S8 family peptidase [Anaerocolumna sp.]
MDPICSEWIVGEDYSDFIAEYRADTSELEATPDICFNIINDTHAAVYTPTSLLPRNVIQTYGYSTFPKIYGLMDTSSLEASGVQRLRNIPNLSLNGQGVLIGIIDTGIDYTHEAFINADGRSKIVSIWDQTIQTGPAPPTYYYGTEYNREQINEALQNNDPFSIVPTRDDLGHGTFLAGIAAGTPNISKDFSGVVPFAEIVVVKLKQAKQNLRNYFGIPSDAVAFQENDIMFGIRYLINVARSLSKPIAICIGLGTSQGSHDGRNPLDNYLSYMGDQAGIGIVIAAGNEGNTGHHASGVITRQGDQHNTVELNIAPGVEGFTMELWGNAPGTFSIDILSPTGEYIPRIPARIGETREIRFIFEETVINVDYLLLESQTGDQLIHIRFEKPTEGIWRFKVYSSGDLTSEYDIWLPSSEFLGTDTRFVQPDPNYTITSPGDSTVPIVVTAYDHTNNSLYIRASRGYTRLDEINPNFAAPGVNLVGPAPGNTYTTKSGTSVSAAHTAGITAILFEWGITTGYYSQLDSIEIKNLLIRGARRDPNNTYPNRDWGYGILDIYNTFNSLRGEQE